MTSAANLPALLFVPMPPPSSSERWYTGRHFGIVIDAGSSGSRLQIYSWLNPRISEPEARLPRVEKGTEDGEDWVFKVEPGEFSL